MSEYGHRLHFDEKGMGACSETGEKYILQNYVVSKIK
jgi:UDP-2-acetamido-3-amino-2,3-dideoxy-glucuronate N-acetyltransferase